MKRLLALFLCAALLFGGCNTTPSEDPKVTDASGSPTTAAADAPQSTDTAASTPAPELEVTIGIARHVEPADPSAVLRPAIPAGYDTETVLELGKCPGPGFEGLKERGLDGQGLGIAIIGGVLYTEHEEYQDNLVHYEEIGVPENAPPVDSASWAASVAVGKNCGVAPGASLYYIAVDEEDESQQGYIQALQHLIAINRTLPREQKIRAVVINKQFIEEDLSEELQQAIREAVVNLMYVIVINKTYLPKEENNFNAYLYGSAGAGAYFPDKVTRTDLNSDPTDPQSYTPYFKPYHQTIKNMVVDPGTNKIHIHNLPFNKMHVVAAARTFASADGGYAFFIDGVDGPYLNGVDRLLPAYVAGLYVLAAQIDTKLKPKTFFEEALQQTAFVTSGSYTTQKGKAEEYELLYTANPAAMVEWLQQQQEGDNE